VLPHFWKPHDVLQHLTCVSESQNVPTRWTVQKDWPHVLNAAACNAVSFSQPILAGVGFASCSSLGISSKGPKESNPVVSSGKTSASSSPAGFCSAI